MRTYGEKNCKNEWTVHENNVRKKNNDYKSEIFRIFFRKSLND